MHSLLARRVGSAVAREHALGGTWELPACRRGAAQAAALSDDTAQHRAWQQREAQPPLGPQQHQQQEQLLQERHRGARGAGAELVAPFFRGLLVDAAGTLLGPSEPAAEVGGAAAGCDCEGGRGRNYLYTHLRAKNR